MIYRGEGMRAQERDSSLGASTELQSSTFGNLIPSSCGSRLSFGSPESLVAMCLGSGVPTSSLLLELDSIFVAGLAGATIASWRADAQLRLCGRAAGSWKVRERSVLWSRLAS
jgi:hypothetical protein